MEILIDKKCNRIGVYKITNLIDSKIYIGSTWAKSGLYGRVSHHRNSLIRKDHKNDYLQNAVNKHGINNFKGEVQEYCNNKEELPSRESYWITFYGTLNQDKGYNIAKDTSCPFRGIPKPQKWHDKMDKEYHLLDPQGNKVHVKGMRQFCRDNGLSQENMVPMLSGKTRQAGGWRLYDPELIGVPFDAVAAKQTALAKIWSKRPKDTVKLPYTLEELIRFYVVDKLSLAKTAQKCGKKDWTYIRKILIKAGVKMRTSGGK